MTEQALDQALRLARSPGLARRYRSAPLPGGMLQVLRIAAGDEPAIGEATASTERSVNSLQEAACFYIVQILLSSGGDDYRTLGTNADATREELRAHMVWLLKWLHPDTHEGQPHTVFATRVIKAWENLRTDRSRELYRAGKLRDGPPPSGSDRNVKHRSRMAAFGGARIRSGESRMPLWRRWAVPVVLGSLVASCIALATLYFATVYGVGYAPDLTNSPRIEAESSSRH